MPKHYLNLINEELSLKYYVIIFAVAIIGILLIFLFINQFSLYKYIDKEKILRDKIADLEKNEIISKATIDQLRKKNAEIERVIKTVPPPIDFRINIMEDPINYIKKDLVKRNDLIPYEAVVGGTMGFYDENRIHILNHRWVYAHFEDGHIGGEMLLKYDLTDNGKIDWQVIASLP